MKKCLTIILSVCMIVCMMPFQVFAVNNDSVVGEGDYPGYSVKEQTFKFNNYGDSDKRNYTYYYSDGYFAGDPRAYDSHLATMSAELAITSEYGGCGSLLKNMGFYNPNYMKTDEPVADAYNVQAYFAYKEMKKDNETGNGEYIIAVVPCLYKYGITEWKSNAIIGTNGDSKGFSDGADLILEYLDSYISNNNLTDKVNSGKVRFWVTGFSRGGAIANLIAKRLIDSYNVSENTNKVFAYPMAACSAGNEAKQNPDTSLYESIHNIVNPDDLVTLLVPENYSFVRYGNDHIIDTRTEEFKTEYDKMCPGNDYNEQEFKIAYVNKDIVSILNETLKTKQLSFGSFIKDVDSNVTMNQYFTDLFRYFMYWEVKTRFDYTHRNYVIYSIGSTKADTFENALSDVLGFVMGGDGNQKEMLLKCITNDIVNHLGVLNIPDLAVDLVKWNSTSRLSKVSNTKKTIDIIRIFKCLDACSYVENGKTYTIKSILGDEYYKKFRKDFPVFMDFLISFISNDFNRNYSDGDNRNLYGLYGKSAVLIGTLIYNAFDAQSFTLKDVLYERHFINMYAAALKFEDSYYK